MQTFYALKVISYEIKKMTFFPQKCHSIFQFLSDTQKISIKSSVTHLHTSALFCISLTSAFHNMTFKKLCQRKTANKI